MGRFTFRTLHLIWVLTSLLLLGCNKDNPASPQPLPPTLSFETASVNTSPEGGPSQIKYKINNPIEGATVSAQCKDTWISEINTATPGVISFMVAANETTQARETVVEVSYADIQKISSFTVKQTAPGTAKPEILFVQESVDAPAQGGVSQIEYKINNPIEGAAVSATCPENWVSNLNTETAGIVSFETAGNNTSSPREAVVTIQYGDIQQIAQFTIKQEAVTVVEEAFKIAISEVTTKTFVVNVTPKDKEMFYLLNVLPASATKDFTTDEDFYNYDVEFYKDMDWGFGWESIAQEALQQGTIADRLIENMTPDTEYVVYAYGVNQTTIERLTPISKETLKTLIPEEVNADFDLQITSVNGLDIDVRVTAKGYDGYFVAKIFSNVKDGDTDETVLEKISTAWSDNVQIFGWMGYTSEMILSQEASKLSKEIHETLEPNQKYYIYAFAVDDDALRCTDITILPFSTNDTTVQQ